MFRPFSVFMHMLSGILLDQQQSFVSIRQLIIMSVLFVSRSGVLKTSLGSIFAEVQPIQIYGSAYTTNKLIDTHALQ